MRQRTDRDAADRDRQLSELPMRQRTSAVGGVACLVFSELLMRQRTGRHGRFADSCEFLSCLCGSEPAELMAGREGVFCELPMRQRTARRRRTHAWTISELPMR